MEWRGLQHCCPGVTESLAKRRSPHYVINYNKMQGILFLRGS
jgi:hypothetical protein